MTAAELYLVTDGGKALLIGLRMELPNAWLKCLKKADNFIPNLSVNVLTRAKFHPLKGTLEGVVLSKWV